MSEYSEAEHWENHKEEMHQMRQKRNEQAAEDVEFLAKDGIRAVYITPWQIRFEDCLDVWPSNKNWHDLQTQARGRYRRLKPFIYSFFEEDMNVTCTKATCPDCKKSFDPTSISK